ncbi:MAG: UTP--glucose-1-phosphate uridylyltransferase [Zetaproteobacteria bacterium CG06_land_8_20_14_3_00_59_53]|nr:MAG: UTP--glucose-1-phosphate uridylyltransferase [Zetaproteobacteria bacterium CG2_30_59_37]PIO90335.1 MAG: UTP--glucose-1-phosphate uridylyltransferase [Zetaproteobacteria bacterium CG23_combo_of_CG06-09_8_20_14_all_59_86]PIQ65099.1 MAG: UTP--glucose-1-phosphate uridylyltransferase [Zetaproteobacteria bacterium CG11_big_fil_rev_8_21_14_0_20_59_439]PIU70149.1 MAG: UTP--glucose-1-phosphate uridylyltransferase [Zetaproteobacteria bacterium CG06_land_8_20_14_3_00_59_53]PIU96120.1 MAG: UTP--glu
MKHQLRKIVFPTAGLGTRFLPATKASPKEMLTIVDKPLIQYGVEEALAAGMDEIIMVTGRGKRAIEDHFDISAELEANLKAAGKEALYQEVSRVARMAEVIYVRQKQALGLGHAVSCAAHWVGDEPFGVVLADELIIAEKPVMQQLREVFEKTGRSVIGLMRVPMEMVSRYGVVAAVEENDLLRLTDMVEKPQPADAPSDLAIIGRYIFTPRLFELLEETKPGKGGEIQLTDAVARLAKEEPVYGVLIEGNRFDAGNPMGFLMANAELGARHPQFGGEFSNFLRNLLQNN